MKRKLFVLFISLTFTLNFGILMNVKAFSENAFANGSCITNTDWQSTATTGYKLNTETGTYEKDGTAYSESSSSLVYYMPSEDGKILYAYVPNYNTVIGDEKTRTEIFNKGIVTTQTCASTYKMQKTVVGNPPSEDSDNEADNADNNSEPGDDVAESNNGDPVDVNEEGSDTDVEKLEAPNTASPMAIALIVLSVSFVLVAVYSFLKRTKPELFKRNIDNNNNINNN